MTVLFGSIFGISGSAALVAVLVALGLIAVLTAIARPLLFASVDPAVAAARGVPVRLLGALFLGLAGVSAAEASQAIGALLLFGLLAAPPAAALRLTSRPWHALALSGGLAVLAVWIGLAVSLRRTQTAAQLHHHVGGDAGVRPGDAGRPVAEPAAGSRSLKGRPSWAAGQLLECSGQSPKTSTVWVTSV